MMEYSNLKFAEELKNDIPTIVNLMATLGHNTKVVGEVVTILPRDSKTISYNVLSEAYELMVKYNNIHLLDENVYCDDDLSYLLSEVTMGVVANTVCRELDINDLKRYSDMYRDLAMLTIYDDKALDTTLIPIPRISYDDEYIKLCVFVDNRILDTFNEYLLRPIRLHHIITSNHYSLMELSIPRYSNIEVSCLIDRQKLRNMNEATNITLTYTGSLINFDRHLLIQRVLTSILIQEQYSKITNEEIFEIILKII